MIRSFLLSLICAAGLAQADDQALQDLSAGNALGGADILSAIRTAPVVTAQRVDSQLAESADNAPEKVTLIELGKPFPLSEPDAETLKAILTRNTTHLSPAKNCEFRANVMYTFATPDPAPPIHAVLCFGCGEFEIRRGEKLVSFGPFDGGYAELLALTQRLFPDDTFLASFTPEKFQERVSRFREQQP